MQLEILCQGLSFLQADFAMGSSYGNLVNLMR